MAHHIIIGATQGQGIGCHAVYSCSRSWKYFWKPTAVIPQITTAECLTLLMKKKKNRERKCDSPKCTGGATNTIMQDTQSLTRMRRRSTIISLLIYMKKQRKLNEHWQSVQLCMPRSINGRKRKTALRLSVPPAANGEAVTKPTKDRSEELRKVSTTHVALQFSQGTILWNLLNVIYQSVSCGDRVEKNSTTQVRF